MAPATFRCLVREARGKVLPNGTRSLALKHLLAYDQIRRRGLDAALVLEDDANPPPTTMENLQLCAWRRPH